MDTGQKTQNTEIITKDRWKETEFRGHRTESRYRTKDKGRRTQDRRQKQRKEDKGHTPEDRGHQTYNIGYTSIRCAKQYLSLFSSSSFDLSYCMQNIVASINGVFSLSSDPVTFLPEGVDLGF